MFHEMIYSNNLLQLLISWPCAPQLHMHRIRLYIFENSILCAVTFTCDTFRHPPSRKLTQYKRFIFIHFVSRIFPCTISLVCARSHSPQLLTVKVRVYQSISQEKKLFPPTSQAIFEMTLIWFSAAVGTINVSAQILFNKCFKNVSVHEQCIS